MDAQLLRLIRKKKEEKYVIEIVNRTRLGSGLLHFTDIYTYTLHLNCKFRSGIFLNIDFSIFFPMQENLLSGFNMVIKKKNKKNTDLPNLFSKSQMVQRKSVFIGFTETIVTFKDEPLSKFAIPLFYQLLREFFILSHILLLVIFFVSPSVRIFPNILVNCLNNVFMSRASLFSFLFEKFGI